MSQSQDVSPRVKNGWVVLAGLILILAGPLAYMPLMDNAYLRNSGLLLWVLTVAGLVLTQVYPARDRRMKIRAVSWVSAALAIFYVVGFYFGASLPKATAFDTLERSPAFTLSNQEGEAVSVPRGDGAALLVFYRGHW